MPRRPQPRRSRQHHKGRKRPRAWHRSRSSGAVFARLLAAIEAKETP